MATIYNWLAMHASPNKRADRKKFRSHDTSKSSNLSITSLKWKIRHARMVSSGRSQEFKKMETLADMAEAAARDNAISRVDRCRLRPHGAIYTAIERILPDDMRNGRFNHDLTGHVFTSPTGRHTTWKDIFLVQDHFGGLYEPLFHARMGENGVFEILSDSTLFFGDFFEKYTVKDM